MCSLSSINQDIADRHDTFLNCTGYNSAWDFTQLIKNKKCIHAHFYCFWWILFNIRTSSSGGRLYRLWNGSCRSAIVFPISSLKISRFLERKETLGCRQYQVPWDTGLVWCVVLVHVISEMRVGVLTENWLRFRLFVLSILKSIPPNKSLHIPCLLSAFACTARVFPEKDQWLNAHSSELVILDFWSSVHLDYSQGFTEMS